MRPDLPPIVKLAERLLVDVEQAVAKFARSHRYVIGQDLRKEAQEVLRTALRAWRCRDDRVYWARQLDLAVDALKTTLTICSKLRAFCSGGAFEALARTAADLGRQVGGWRKQLEHPQGQSAAPRTGDPQRAKTLSGRGAPAGAT